MHQDSCSPGVHQVCTRCATGVHHLGVHHVITVHQVCTRYAPGVHWGVHYVCTTCAPGVHYLGVHHVITVHQWHITKLPKNVISA